MVRYLPMIIVLGLTIYCIIDVLVTPRERLRSLGKIGWLLVTLIPLAGAVLWLALGRPRRGPKPVIHLRRPERAVAPDDDPDFLRLLEERAWRAQREARKKAEGGTPQAQAPSKPDKPGPPPEQGPEVLGTAACAR